MAPQHWTRFATESMLGEALMGQKKYEEAKPLLLNGYQVMEQLVANIPPQGMIRLTEALDRVIAYYEATDDVEEAKKW